MNAHVRWPARPELRAGLDLFEIIVFSFFCPAKGGKRNKEKGTGNDVRPLPDAVIKPQRYY
jgi:hypothetical protein